MSIKTIVVTGMLLLAGTIVSRQTSTNQVKEKNMEKLELVKEWDKVFPQSSKVVHEKVTFRNRYGITLAAGYVYPPKCGGEIGSHCGERSFRGCQGTIVRALRANAGGTWFSDDRFRSFLHG